MTQNSKDNIIVWVSVTLLIGAFVLAVLGFYMPPEGEISDSVLWFFAQCLVFTGSIFGINVYVRSKVNDIATNIVERTRNNRNQISNHLEDNENDE